MKTLKLSKAQLVALGIQLGISPPAFSRQDLRRLDAVEGKIEHLIGCALNPAGVTLDLDSADDVVELELENWEFEFAEARWKANDGFLGDKTARGKVFAIDDAMAAAETK